MMNICCQFSTMSVQINKMASITMMFRGALINVTALVGSSKYLSGDQHSAVEEKKRHDLTVEK